MRMTQTQTPRVKRLGRLAGTVCAVIAACALTPSRAFAQSNDEVFPQFQWNFATPGARANAMGGAFIGLADDASAAVTNPAGLLNLTRPQVYFEYKNTDLRVARLAAVDSFFTGTPTTTSKMISVPSFLSVSAPIGSTLAVGFSRHEFLNDRENFTLGPRAVPGAASLGYTQFPVDGSSNFSATSYLGTIAYRVDDRLRVGVSFGIDHLNASSQAQRFAVLCSAKGCGDIFGVTTRSVNGQPLVVSQTAIDNSSSGASFAAGALFTPNDRISIGAQFSKGSSLSVDEHLQVNPGFQNLISDTNQPLLEVNGSPVTVPIDVPNRFGVGIAVRPSSRFVATADIVHVTYSSLASHFVVVIDSASLTADEYAIPDTTEIHFGGEYMIRTGSHPVFVRAGIYTSPDHSTTFVGTTVPLSIDTDAAQQAIYNTLPKNTRVIGTVGVGLSFGKHAQADIAYTGMRELIASLGARF